MTDETAKKRFFSGGRFSGAGKYAFWGWVAYQAVKGTLTTSFIWIPMIYFFFFT